MSQDRPPSSDADGLEFTEPDPADGGDQLELPRARRFPIGWLLLAIVVGGVLYAGMSWWNTRQAVQRRLEKLEKDREAEQRMVEPVDGSDHPVDPAIKFARENLARFQQDVVDYTATMIKRERIEGELLPPATMFIRIRNPLEREGDPPVPLSIYVRFDDPANLKGREVIWIEGENDGNIIAHEAGFLNFKRLVLKPTGILPMVGNRYPVTEMGIGRLLQKMIVRLNQDRQYKNCEVQMEPDVPLGTCRGTRVVISHPERSANHDFFRAEVELDTSLFSYVRYAAYDWPPEAGKPAPLLEEYIYQEVKLNPGLEDSAFDPDNPEYNYP